MSAWYQTGTVTVASGSATVTGVSTAWLDNIGVGDVFTLDRDKFYAVSAIATDGSLTISPAWAGANLAGQAYFILQISRSDAQLAARLAETLRMWNNREIEMVNWLAGTVDGGPNNDGTYPLTDVDGNVQYVRCPAWITDVIGDPAITTASEIVSALSPVLGRLTDISAVGAAIHTISAVGGNITNIAAVGGNITNVLAVAADLTTLNLIAADLTTINLVAADLTNINAVAADLTTINLVAADLTNINAVAADLTTINLVAASLNTINAVAADLNTINAVAASLNTINAAQGYASAAASSASAASTSASNAATSETNAAASATSAAASATALQGTSTTSLTPAIASKVFTTQSGKDFNVGSTVLAVSAADATIYMFGNVTAYSGTSLTVNVTAIGTASAKADWNIFGRVGLQGIQGNTGAAGSVPLAAAGGSADAITADFSPDVTLVDKTFVCVIAASDNATTTPTFAPDGLTAHTIVKFGGKALLAGDIKALGPIILEYNSANTRWELLNPATARDVTAFALTFLDDADAATVRTTLGVTPFLADGGTQATGFTAAINTKYTAAFGAAGTITLPASASVDDIIVLALAGNYNYALAPNGLKINSSTSTLNVPGNQTLMLCYTGATDGWV